MRHDDVEIDVEVQDRLELMCNRCGVAVQTEGIRRFLREEIDVLRRGVKIGRMMEVGPNVFPELLDRGAVPAQPRRIEQVGCILVVARRHALAQLDSAGAVFHQDRMQDEAQVDLTGTAPGVDRARVDGIDSATDVARVRADSDEDAVGDAPGRAQGPGPPGGDPDRRWAVRL